MELRTERLRLRPFTAADAPHLQSLFNEAGVRRYLWDDREVTREMVDEQVDGSQQRFSAGGIGHFTLRLLDSDVPMGCAGLCSILDPMRVELIYALHPDHWGVGLATEASREVLRFGFASGLREIIAGADPPNAASFRVMERLGMAPLGDFLIRGLPARYYGIDREAFAG